MWVSRATVGRGMPVSVDSSMLPSNVLPALNASSTTRPFASVVAKAASSTLSASTAAAEEGGCRGLAESVRAIPDYRTEVSSLSNRFVNDQ